ncbi:MAG: hypothetical protein ONB16_06420 [candidate division KSB1 bacterium]|nr:hypothetical protein [candidate division KSB1 bacterium]
MKDIVITRNRIKKEVFSLAVMFLIALCLNIFAIIAYDTNWSELITELPFVVVIALVLYLCYTMVRIIIVLIKAGFR